MWLICCGVGEDSGSAGGQGVGRRGEGEGFSGNVGHSPLELCVTNTNTMGGALWNQ